MGIIRTPKHDNFTILDNTFLRDPELSFKAKGLMSWMLSCPDNWDFTVAGIVSCAKESRDAIRGMLKELEDAGYLVREFGREKSGKYGVNYELVEKPVRKNRSGKTVTDDQPQISTIKSNTKTGKKEKERKKGELPEPTVKVKGYKELISSLVENTTVQEKLLEYVYSKCSKERYLKNVQVEVLVNQLVKLSEKPEEQIKIIKQSLLKGWNGFYALKKTGKKSGYRTGAVAKKFTGETAKDEAGNEIVY